MGNASVQRQRPTHALVADQLVEGLPLDARIDLAAEDPATAVEYHFPSVTVRALPTGIGSIGDQCSTDGYYECRLDPARPTIVFSNELGEARARFTILHELAHHLLVTDASSLLEDIDIIGGSQAGAAEEVVCHLFAGRILVSDEQLRTVFQPGVQLLPAHVCELHDETNASWDAVAVRCAQAAAAKNAVVLIRAPGRISLGAASSRLRPMWWPRGSFVQPGGPLSRAFDRDQRAAKDTYRHGLSHAEQLFCDTLKIHDALVVAVMGDRRSDGRWDLLADTEPNWRDREEFCEWCNEERDQDWCDRCRGRRCGSCGRCGCEHPLPAPICSGCGNPEPVNPGSAFCRSCELDGRQVP